MFYSIALLIILINIFFGVLFLSFNRFDRLKIIISTLLVIVVEGMLLYKILPIFPVGRVALFFILIPIGFIIQDLISLKISTNHQILILFKKLSYLMLIIITVEITIFNANFWVNQNKDTKMFDLGRTIILDQESRIENNTLILGANTASIELAQINLDTENILIVTKGINRFSKGYLSIKDNSRAFEYQLVNTFTFNPGSILGQQDIQIKLVSSGLKSIIIEFEPLGHETVIEKIVLNPTPILQINSYRLVLMLFIGSIVLLIKYFNIHLINYDSSLVLHRTFISFIFLFALLATLLISHWVKTSVNTKEYTLPLIQEEAHLYQPYVQQVDAFLKGQVNLDVIVDPRLAEINNVYDVTERAYEGVGAYWDRVYFNGSYYSYFGIAPILLVYLPFYSIFNILPSDLFVMTVLSILSIGGLFLALLEMSKHFVKKRNLLILGLTLLASSFGSLVYMLQANPNFYHIAIQSMIGTLTFYLYFVYKAINDETKSKVNGCFTLVGIFAVLLVLSRPHVVIIAIALTSPVLIEYLIKRDLKIRTKLINICLFLIPIIIGGIGTSYYNYIRFNSIYEFGSTYQLTAHDISQNHLEINNIFESIYVYFLQFPWFSNQFPFINFVTFTNTTGKYLYQTKNIGVLTFPIVWFVLIYPFKSMTKGRIFDITVLMIIFMSLTISFIDFSLAGIHIRYIPDIAVGLMLISSIIILKNNEMGSHSYVYRIYVIALLLTIIIGLLLVFNNEMNIMFDSNADVYMKIQRIFGQ